MNALRAVFDDGNRHAEGKVRGMWSAGLVLESEAAPQQGSVVALVVLSGGFDGERLATKVSSVEKGAWPEARCCRGSPTTISRCSRAIAIRSSTRRER